MIIETTEFDFNGKTYIISKDVLDPTIGVRSTWPEWRVMSSEKVKFKFKDLGEHRWLCFAEIPFSVMEEFETWLNNNLGDRFMLSKRYDYEEGSIKRIYEIRGGSIADRSLMVLRWT